MAIIVEGGQLSNDLLRQIQHYMETEIKGQGHKTLVLDVPGSEPGVEFTPELLEGPVIESEEPPPGGEPPPAEGEMSSA